MLREEAVEGKVARQREGKNKAAEGGEEGEVSQASETVTTRSLRNCERWREKLRRTFVGDSRGYPVAPGEKKKGVI